MPKKYILRYHKKFKNLYRNGIKVRSRYFSCLFVKSDDLAFAFVVTKKVARKAVNRNYSRRVMKEIVRNYVWNGGKCASSAPKLNGVNIILKSLFDLKELKKKSGFELIKRDLESLLNKVKTKLNMM